MGFRPKATALGIPIAFHVLTDGKSGKITDRQVSTLIDNLNWAFRNSPFSFYLYRVDTTQDKAWYGNCVVNTKNQQKIRQKLALDTRYFINVYSCKLGERGLLGRSTFPPGYPGAQVSAFLQGVALDPLVLGSAGYPRGLALAHEIGHYLGLFHTFETVFNPGSNGCTAPGDLVDDTPTQAFNTFGACPSNVDSCPALPGADDISNFMNYSTDACWDHFTPGQVDVMVQAVSRFRPDLGTR